MRIMVDGYNIGLAQGTGVATYGKSFISAAQALGHHVALLCESDVGHVTSGMAGTLRTELRKIQDFLAAQTGLSVRRAPPAPHEWAKRMNVPHVQETWQRHRLFRAAKGAYRRTGRFVPVPVPSIDVAHWTYPLPMFVPGAKNIYTIHDMVPLMHPEMARNGHEYARLCADIAARADMVLTVSEQSRRDIEQALGLPSRRVVNAYQCVELDMPPEELLQRVLLEHGLERRNFFLYCGAIEPKKNVQRLLEAYRLSGVTAPFVLVGKAGWQCDNEVATLTRLTQDRESGIIWLNYAPRETLLALLCQARALLFPSLLEGFGLPVLESMILGTPVLTSNIGALAEVAQDGALLVSPHSVDSIARGIAMLDQDAALRAQLEAKGRKRADFFSPLRYQGRLADLLRTLT